MLPQLPLFCSQKRLEYQEHLKMRIEWCHLWVPGVTIYCDKMVIRLTAYSIEWYLCKSVCYSSKISTVDEQAHWEEGTSEKREPVSWWLCTLKGLYLAGAQGGLSTEESSVSRMMPCTMVWTREPYRCLSALGQPPWQYRGLYMCGHNPVVHISPGNSSTIPWRNMKPEP